MIWVNVDITTKKFTLHTTRRCRYVEGMRDTPFKGLGELKRDGGWLSYENRESALAEHAEKFAKYEVVEHC